MRRLSRSARPVLIILDNVTIWTEKDHPRPIPEGTHVTLLVTTRDRYLGGTRFKRHPLQVLPPDAARILVLQLAGEHREAQPGFDDLLAHLDGHALALELAGAYLGEYPEVTPATYLERLRSGAPVESRVSGRNRYEKTVAEALGTTWNSLDEAGQRAWLIAACFSDEPANPEISDAAELDGEGRHALRRLHIIDDAGNGRWRMHRLTRAFGVTAGTPGARDDALRAFVKGCVERAGLIDLASGFRIYAPDRTHFDRALECADRAGLDHLAVSFLQDRLGAAHQSIGQLSQARELLELALDSNLKNLGANHPIVATRRSNLAVLLQDLGDLPRARELFELALDSDLKNFGEDHPLVATSRSNLAIVLKDQGNLPRARELLEFALESAVKYFGEDHPAVAPKRNNLAGVLRALGDLPRAKQLFELALNSALKSFGTDHPWVATSRSNLALVLKDPGDLPRAKQLLELALVSDLKNLGEDHPSVATRRYNLAAILEAKGDERGALEQLDSTLSIELKCLGREHPPLALTRATLATVLLRMGQADRARDEAREALRVAETQPAGSSYRVQIERLTKGIVGEP